MPHSIYRWNSQNPLLNVASGRFARSSVNGGLEARAKVTFCVKTARLIE